MKVASHRWVDTIAWMVLIVGIVLVCRATTTSGVALEQMRVAFSGDSAGIAGAATVVAALVTFAIVHGAWRGRKR